MLALAKVNDYNRYATKLPRFYETIEDDFHFRKLGLKGALKSREQAVPLSENNVARSIDKHGMVNMIAGLSENALRSVHGCKPTKAAWEKLHPHYASKSTVSKIQ